MPAARGSGNQDSAAADGGGTQSPLDADAHYRYFPMARPMPFEVSYPASVSGPLALFVPAVYWGDDEPPEGARQHHTRRYGSLFSAIKSRRGAPFLLVPFARQLATAIALSSLVVTDPSQCPSITWALVVLHGLALVATFAVVPFRGIRNFTFLVMTALTGAILAISTAAPTSIWAARLMVIGSVAGSVLSLLTGAIRFRERAWKLQEINHRIAVAKASNDQADDASTAALEVPMLTAAVTGSTAKKRRIQGKSSGPAVEWQLSKPQPVQLVVQLHAPSTVLGSVF